MLRVLLPLLAVGLSTPSLARAQDPLSTDGGKYMLVLENERVRVLVYYDRPGEKTSLHAHPDFVLVALTPFNRRLSFPDGTMQERRFGAGDAVFVPAQWHVGENIGSTDTNVLIIELKEPPRRALARAAGDQEPLDAAVQPETCSAEGWPFPADICACT